MIVVQRGGNTSNGFRHIDAEDVVLLAGIAVFEHSVRRIVPVLKIERDVIGAVALINDAGALSVNSIIGPGEISGSRNDFAADGSHEVDVAALYFSVVEHPGECPDTGFAVFVHLVQGRNLVSVEGERVPVGSVCALALLNGGHPVVAAIFERQLRHDVRSLAEQHLEIHISHLLIVSYHLQQYGLHGLHATLHGGEIAGLRHRIADARQPLVHRSGNVLAQRPVDVVVLEDHVVRACRNAVGDRAADARRGGHGRQLRTGLGGIGGLQEDARSRGETVTGDLQCLVQLDRSGQHDARHRVLRSLQAHRTQVPAAVLLHDDGVHAGREGRRNRTFDPRGLSSQRTASSVRF